MSIICLLRSKLTSTRLVVYFDRGKNKMLTREETTTAFDDIANKQAVQALKAIKIAMEDIIEVYQVMSEEEQRAFDLGESY